MRINADNQAINRSRGTGRIRNEKSSSVWFGYGDLVGRFVAVISQAPDSAQVAVHGSLGLVSQLQVLGRSIIELAIEMFGTSGFVVALVQHS